MKVHLLAWLLNVFWNFLSSHFLFLFFLIATTSIMHVTEIMRLIWAACKGGIILDQNRCKLNLLQPDYNNTHPLFMRLSNNSDSFGLQALFLSYCLVFGLVLIWQLFLQSPWNNQGSEHLWLTFDWLQNRFKHK